MFIYLIGDQVEDVPVLRLGPLGRVPVGHQGRHGVRSHPVLQEAPFVLLVLIHGGHLRREYSGKHAHGGARLVPVQEQQPIGVGHRGLVHRILLAVRRGAQVLQVLARQSHLRRTKRSLQG